LFLITHTGFTSYAQNINGIVTVNNSPSQDYLFLGLSFGGVGRLWIVDNDLTPVFYRKVVGTIFDFKYQPNGELVYNIYSTESYGMDSSGIPSNRFFTPEGFALDIHELQVLEDGSYYILGRDLITIDISQYITGGDTAAVLVANTIHHMDSNDNELWRWESINHYNILDVDDHVDLTQHTIDWTHCNSIEIDSDSNLILSTRNFNEITKTNRQTGEIIWRLGGKRNQFQFMNDNRGFGRQHDVRRHSNGNIILFDNGHHLIPEYSSYIEYELDETIYYATLIRRYTRNESVFAQTRGGVQELADGHTLICWGQKIDPAVTEFNDENLIEFEMMFPVSQHQYRAYRFAWQTNYIFVNTDSLNFGTVAVGDSSLQKLWMINKKNYDVIINEFYLSDSTFTVQDSLPITVPQQDSVEITVYFKPYTEGVFTDKLNIRHHNDTLLIGKQVKLYAQTTLVSVKGEEQQPNKYSLSQNFPNPFNPSTTIRYSIKERTFVNLVMYDILGRDVEVLVNQEQDVGSHKINFNAGRYTSGIYFYQLKAGDFVETKKMVLMK
jgi:hypothetical protein